MQLPREDYVKVFQFLDNLRESGVANMFGAAKYVQEAFCLDSAKSRQIAVKWMETFDGVSTVEDRVNSLQDFTINSNGHAVPNEPLTFKR